MTLNKITWKTHKADQSAMGAINRPLQPVDGLPLVPIIMSTRPGVGPVERDLSPPLPIYRPVVVYLPRLIFETS